jgi:crotonobetainyl-CoA:carnitine CoA-transferase CaiB-like acyl-CoA transferase
MAAPLSQIRVLDLSRILAGPWAGQTLADLGAEVIKVERPGEGDETRGWGPPFLPGRDEAERGDAAYYLCANRGKASVCIDMGKAEGQDLIRTLAKRCDVVIENFKVGGLEKYGLDYESLSAVNPRLVYCSITGFGQTGPYAKRAGYDFMIQGMGGIMSVTGQPDGTPGAEPLKGGVAFADLFTGLYATIGILAALAARDSTGRGQHVDMALLDCQVAVLANQALNYLASGEVPTRLGNAHPNIVPYQAFATADGHLILAIGTGRQFRAFCEIAGLAGVADDARFLTNRDRVEHRAELVALIAPVMTERTTQAWVAALEDAAVPCGPISTIDEVFANPQVVARGLQIELARPNGEKTPSVANPIRLSGTPIEQGRAAPALGADTRDVLMRVAGLSADEVTRLEQGGIVAG